MSGNEPGRSPVLYLAFGLLAGVGLSAVAALVFWQLWKPAPPKPETPAPPSTTQAPETPEAAPSPPEAEAQAAPAVPAPPVRPPAAAKPKPAPLPPELGAMLKHAQSATQEQRYEAAASLYDEILKRDPQNAEARLWKANAQALRRSFVFSMAEAENLKGTPGRLDGFDPGGVEVKRAAEVPGRLEFEVAPSRVKPGDHYTVKIYLLNTGKKTIKIKEMNVARMVNGTRASTPAVPRAREIEPRGRALLDVLPGVWTEDTASWSVQVLVTSNRGDSYMNEVVWK